MYSFNNDYSEGACKPILENLIKTNFVQADGYGLDKFCLAAEKLLKIRLGDKDVDVHFVTGGTPANALAATLLKPYEALICAENGHINVHETGAVEATGHKILTSKGVDGKITAKEIEDIVLVHPDEHMVKPKMVFISNPSELGTIYSKQELTDISNICKKYNLYLYMDGARLANALTAANNDITLKDLTKLLDIFYIGGTKNGCLLGEAMVIKNDELKPNFRFLIKQHNSMLAKERTIGVEFLTLFENDLFYQNGDNANKMAQQLKQFFIDNNIKMYVDSPTNQIFPILDNDLIIKLRQNYLFSNWKTIDDNHTAVRFVCSWACKQENIDEFKQYFNQLLHS